LNEDDPETSGDGTNNDSGGGNEDSAKPAESTLEDGAAKDKNSIYVGQVDYEATGGDVATFFSSCGSVERVTIVCDKHTGHAKGYAYVEFVDADSVENALRLDGKEFMGRELKVMQKRKNEFGMGASSYGYGGRGGGRGLEAVADSVEEGGDVVVAAAGAEAGAEGTTVHINNFMPKKNAAHENAKKSI